METASALRQERSKVLYAQACQLIPGGVNSPVRAMRQIGREPLFIARGEGAYLFDVDGNRYVDWVMSWGPLIAGHRHPAVIEAVEEACAAGLTFGAPTEREVLLAREVVERVPAADAVRMVCSGTEAVMTALRLARAATGRETVIKFAGGYHGHIDQLLVEAGSGLATAALPASAGIPTAVASQTVVVPFNDPAALAEAVERFAPAAVLVEPLPANMGVVPPAEGFLATIRQLCDKAGALLIFDEVISGFRVARGGAVELYGVEPDLITFGKVIGGGLPVGAVAGRRALMERLAPVGDVYQAGTLAGNPLAMAAGLATLQLLDPAAYATLSAVTGALAAQLKEVAAPYPVCVVEAPGLLTVFFREEPPRNLAEVQGCDLEAFARFARAMLGEGVYIPPSQFEAWFPSLAHGEREIEQTVAAARRALRQAF